MTKTRKILPKNQLTGSNNNQNNPGQKSPHILYIAFEIPPPVDICMIIFFFLHPRELLAITQLNKMWYKFCANSREYNQIWWKLCMNGWYEIEKLPPMNRNDRRRNWKEIFLRIGPKEVTMTTERDEHRGKKNHLNHLAWIEENLPATKTELRQHYQNTRAKPKGKRVQRDPICKTDWSMITE